MRMKITENNVIYLDINVFALFILLVALIFSRYRVTGMGYILFSFEVILAIVLFSHLKIHKFYLGHIVALYLLFIVYRIIVSLMVVGGISGNVKAISHRELGIFLIAYMISKSDSVIKCIKCIRNFGIICAYLGVVEFITHSNFFTKFISESSYENLFTIINIDAFRVRVIFLHPIICAVFMVVTWLIILFFPLKNKLINVVSVISIIVCIIGTQSRSSWVSFVIVTVLYLSFVRAKRIKRNITIFNITNKLFGILGIVLLLFTFREKIKSMSELVLKRWIIGINRASATNYNRVTMIWMGLREYLTLSFGGKLFGKGSGAALSLLQNNSINGWTTAVDNTYISTLLDYGFIGLFFLILIGFISMINLFKSENKIVIMNSLIVLSLMISGFFYDMFSWYTTTFCFCFFICTMDLNDRAREQICIVNCSTSKK